MDIILTFLNSIPEWFVVSYLGLALLGLNVKLKKIITMTLALSLASLLTKNIIFRLQLGGLHIVFYLFLLMLAYRYLLPLKRELAVAAALTVYNITFSLKFILMERVLTFFGTGPNLLTQDPWLDFMVNNSLNLALYIIGLLVYFTGFKVAKFSALDDLDPAAAKAEKKALFTVNIILVNLLLTNMLAVYYFMWKRNISYSRQFTPEIITVMFFVFSAVIIAGIVIPITNIYRQLKNIKKAEDEEDKITATRNTVEVLQAEREEFGRQLTFISGLIAEGNKEELTQYINDVSAEITTIGNLGILDKPELKVLLLQKAKEARKKNISAQYNINASLTNLQVAPSDLVRVIGNLLDNAMEALVNNPCNKKELLFNVYETPKKAVFEVFNNEPIIPPEIQKHIFDKGISSKDEEGHGYGLAIVKELVDKYQGGLSLRSIEEEGTMFSVSFPLDASNKKEIA